MTCRPAFTYSAPTTTVAPSGRSLRPVQRPTCPPIAAPCTPWQESQPEPPHRVHSVTFWAAGWSAGRLGPHHDLPGADGHLEEPGRDADVVLGGQPGRLREPPGARQPQDRHALAVPVDKRSGQHQVPGLAHPVQEGEVLGEPRVIEQRPRRRRRRTRTVHQRDPGLALWCAHFLLLPWLPTSAAYAGWGRNATARSG